MEINLNSTYTHFRRKVVVIEQNQFKTASLLVKLGNAVTYYRNLKMENLDLTSVQSDAFIATLRNPGITASQLKDCLQLPQSTTAGIIARLENKRLITNFYIYI